VQWEVTTRERQQVLCVRGLDAFVGLGMLNGGFRNVTVSGCRLLRFCDGGREDQIAEDQNPARSSGKESPSSFGNQSVCLGAVILMQHYIMLCM